MISLLDPTSCIPLWRGIERIEEFSELLESMLELLQASNGKIAPAVCEDTALVIMEELGNLQAQGGYYRQCALALLLLATNHLTPIDRLGNIVEAEFEHPTDEEIATIFSRDKFSCFASFAASGHFGEKNNDLFIIGNKFSRLESPSDQISINYLSGNGDLQSCHVPFYKNNEQLLNKYGLIDPNILKSIRVENPVQYAWEQTGHTPSTRQRRIIEEASKNSQVVIRSATIYHNPNGRTDRSTVQLRDVIDEIHFCICDNGDVLRGVFKTRASTRQEAQTCLYIIQMHLNEALANF